MRSSVHYALQLIQRNQMALLKNGLQWNKGATKFRNNHSDDPNFETAGHRQNTFGDPITTLLLLLRYTMIL
jgi:hypothetical protein